MGQACGVCWLGSGSSGGRMGDGIRLEYTHELCTGSVGGQ